MVSEMCMVKTRDRITSSINNIKGVRTRTGNRMKLSNALYRKGERNKPDVDISYFVP